MFVLFSRRFLVETLCVAGLFCIMAAFAKWQTLETADYMCIIYVHVPFVWMCMLAFTVNVGAAVAYLLKKSWRTDALAEASAEVGVFFGATGVMMGSMAKMLSGLDNRVPPRSAHKASKVPMMVVPVAVKKASHRVFQATPQRPSPDTQPKPQTRSVATRSNRCVQA